MVESIIQGPKCRLFGVRILLSLANSIFKLWETVSRSLRGAIFAIYLFI